MTSKQWTIGNNDAMQWSSINSLRSYIVLVSGGHGHNMLLLSSLRSHKNYDPTRRTTDPILWWMTDSLRSYELVAMATIMIIWSLWSSHPILASLVTYIIDDRLVPIGHFVYNNILWWPWPHYWWHLISHPTNIQHKTSNDQWRTRGHRPHCSRTILVDWPCGGHGHNI